MSKEEQYFTEIREAYKNAISIEATFTKHLYRVKLPLTHTVTGTKNMEIYSVKYEETYDREKGFTQKYLSVVMAVKNNNY